MCWTQKVHENEEEIICEVVDEATLITEEKLSAQLTDALKTVQNGKSVSGGTRSRGSKSKQSASRACHAHVADWM